MTLLAAAFCAVGASAQSLRARQSKEEYIERYKNIAIDHMERYGIPASITLAQGILESDSGNSTLAKSSNNHFGIKCKKKLDGRARLPRRRRQRRVFPQVRLGGGVVSGPRRLPRPAAALRLAVRIRV